MIKYIDKYEVLKEDIKKLNPDIDLDEVTKIDLPFVDSEGDFTVVHIPSYEKEKKSNIIFVAGTEVLAYVSVKQDKIEKKYEKIEKRKFGKSTISIFMLLKSMLKNYSHEFVKIRDKMNALENEPELDAIEDAGRQLRKLTDRMEGLVQMVIELKEEEADCFDVDLIPFELDLFSTEARYWLERCRSHNYRIASLRTKSEMKSNMELNATMKKLTVIMTFLTIVSIVVNVPGTVGAIFGIPALSDAYFRAHTQMLVFTLILMTLLSGLLGYVYWKSLKLK